MWRLPPSPVFFDRFDFTGANAEAARLHLIHIVSAGLEAARDLYRERLRPFPPSEN
jgi:hypothetical protein